MICCSLIDNSLTDVSMSGSPLVCDSFNIYIKRFSNMKKIVVEYLDVFGRSYFLTRLIDSLCWFAMVFFHSPSYFCPIGAPYVL